jgi:HTH-type transcriptional regulator/antitoxin HipB
MRIVSLADLTSVVRGRRLDLGLSQADVARRAAVSRKWVNEFERGKPRAELGHVLRVLEALGLTVHIGPSPDAGPARSDLDDILDDLRRG